VSEGLYDLPDGWEWAELGDLLTFIGSGITPKGGQQVYQSQGIPFLRSQNVYPDGLRLDGVAYVSSKLHEEMARTHLQQGDVLLNITGASIGRSTLVPKSLGPANVNQHVCILRPSQTTDAKYLSFFLNSSLGQEQIMKAQSGVTRQGLNYSQIRALLIPLTSISEQHRLVEKIERLLAESRTAREALERVPALLKRFRQAVLAKAFRGDLTPGVGSEDEPASVLLERIRAERRRKWEESNGGRSKKYVEPEPPDTSELPELPEGWEWANVGQLAEVVRGASPRPAGNPKYFGGNIPWITVGSLTADDSPYLWSVTEFVTEEGRKKSRYIEPETLMLTNSGATLGVPKITKIGGCFNDGSVALLNVDYPLKLYLYYFLSNLTRKLRTINQGAAQPNLNTSIVKAIVVPLAPLAEQRRIVAKIESLFAQAEAIERAVEMARRRAEKVDQAVLARAFRGGL
jgi:type I restriction enzyme S subunit